MEDLKKLFMAHPNELGESYFQHLKAAWGSAYRLAKIFLALFVHGIFPFLFTTYGFEALERLYADWQNRRNKIKQVE